MPTGILAAQPETIQCDNLKTGVDKHGRNEVTLNQTYCDLPSITVRQLSLQESVLLRKAMVEGTVGVISTFILAVIRKEQFLSLSELNTTIRERLETFNHKLFQKRDAGRASSFEEEKPLFVAFSAKAV